MQFSFALVALVAGVFAAPSNNSTLTGAAISNVTSVVDSTNSSAPSTTLLPTTTSAASILDVSSSASETATSTSLAWVQPTLVNDWPFNATHPTLNNTVTGACESVVCHTGYECHIYSGEAKCVIVSGSQCGDSWCPGNKQCCTTDNCNKCVSLSLTCSADTCASAVAFSP